MSAILGFTETDLQLKAYAILGRHLKSHEINKIVLNVLAFLAKNVDELLLELKQEEQN